MIIFTMAGKGSRFFEAGYNEIKYKLILSGQSILAWCLKPFATMSASTPIILAYNPQHTNSDWLFEQCGIAGLHLKNVELIAITDSTLGQAHTAALALRQSSKDDITKFSITNIDTVYQQEIDFNKFYQDNLSFILCSQFKGDHWSFVKTDGSQRVTEIVEKQRISNLCTTGYYQFASSITYLDYFERILDRVRPEERSEIYVSHVYREMCKEHEIKVGEVNCSDVVLCGTPAEYELAKNAI